MKVSYSCWKAKKFVPGHLLTSIEKTVAEKVKLVQKQVQTFLDEINLDKDSSTHSLLSERQQAQAATHMCVDLNKISQKLYQVLMKKSEEAQEEAEVNHLLCESGLTAPLQERFLQLMQRQAAAMIE